ncbi:MAG: hypothetical protein KCHDKBKB_02139 [Elusimicrobia bacterium]|nr:hypothetical protein [Elusimicrobiota bacterium]
MTSDSESRPTDIVFDGAVKLPLTRVNKLIFKFVVPAAGDTSPEVLSMTKCDVPPDPE